MEQQIRLTRHFVLVEYEITMLAAVAHFGIDKERVELMGTQIIPFGDMLEINEIYLPLAGKSEMGVNMTLIGSNGSVNSYVRIENLSTKLIWDIVLTLREMILY